MSLIKEYLRKHLNNFLIDSTELKRKNELVLTQIDYLKNYPTKKGKVLYTCITGGYEGLLLQEYLNPEWDYFCFTDSEKLLNYKNYGAWQIRPLEFSELDNTKNARWHKMHPHVLFPDYNESIYIDGNIIFTGKHIFNEIQNKKLNLVIPNHWRDDCIYTEIKSVRKNKFDSEENIKKIETFLKENNFPEHYGLNETNLIYRHHNDPRVIKIMEEWWAFIRDFTKRDQLSLTYVLWKNGIKPSEIEIKNLRARAKEENGGVIFKTHK